MYFKPRFCRCNYVNSKREWKHFFFLCETFTFLFKIRFKFMRKIVLFLLLVCITHARLLCSLFGCLCFSATWLYVPRIKMSNVKELGMWHFYSLFIAIIQIMRERETLPKWEMVTRQKAYMKWSRRINSFKEKNSNSKKCLSLKRIEGRVWQTVDEFNTMMMRRDNDSVEMEDKTLKKRVQCKCTVFTLCVNLVLSRRVICI